MGFMRRQSPGRARCRGIGAADRPPCDRVLPRPGGFPGDDRFNTQSSSRGVADEAVDLEDAGAGARQPGLGVGRGGARADGQEGGAPPRPARGRRPDALRLPSALRLRVHRRAPPAHAGRGGLHERAPRPLPVGHRGGPLVDAHRGPALDQRHHRQRLVRPRAQEDRHERRGPRDEAPRGAGRRRLLAAPPPGQHGRRRAEDGPPRLAGDRDLAQGPQRDPDGRPDGRPRPLVGHADGRLRLEHLVRPAAAEVGRGLQRGKARGRVAGPRVARPGRGRGPAGQDARNPGAGVLRQPLRQRVRQRAPRLAGGGRARRRAPRQPRHDRHPGPELLLQRRGGPRQGAALGRDPRHHGPHRPRARPAARRHRPPGRPREDRRRPDRRPRRRAGARADDGVEDARRPALADGPARAGSAGRSRRPSARAPGWRGARAARSTSTRR